MRLPSELPGRSVETLAARAWARRLYPELGVFDPVAEGLWAALGAPRVRDSGRLRALCELEAELESQVAAFWSRSPRGGLLELGAGLSTRLLSFAHHHKRSNLAAIDLPETSATRAWLFASDFVAERAYVDGTTFSVPAGPQLVLAHEVLEPWERRFLREVLPCFESSEVWTIGAARRRESTPLRWS